MKNKKYMAVIIVLLVCTTLVAGCMRLNPAEQFANGLVNMIMLPIETIKGDQEYSKDVSGQIRELMDTRSYEADITFSLDDFSNVDLDTNLLNGAELDISTQYDTASGDMAVDMNGLGLFNASFYLQNSDFAIDIPQLLDELVVMELESQLNFDKPIPLEDRMDDFQKAINTNGTYMDEALTDEMRFVLQHYATLLAENIDVKNVSLSSHKLNILKKSTNCQVITVTFDERDLYDLAEIMLEEAQDDDNLKAFIVNNFMMYSYDSERDAEDDFEDAIDEMLDNLDDAFDSIDTVDLSVSMYYQPAFLFREKSPVAMAVTYEDDDVEVELFYKFFTDGRERDIEFTAAAEDEEIELYLTNILDKNQYVLDGEFNDSMDDIRADFSGTTQLLKSTEQSRMEVSIRMYDDVRIDLEITSELSTIRKGQEYISFSVIDGSVKAEGETMSAVVEVEGSYTFGKTVNIHIPDLDDRDVIRVDTPEELYETIIESIGTIF